MRSFVVYYVSRFVMDADSPEEARKKAKAVGLNVQAVEEVRREDCAGDGRPPWLEFWQAHLGLRRKT